MTTHSTLPPEGEPNALRQTFEGLQRFIANPLVQWVFLIVAMVILLSITSGAAAESPYNRF